MKRMKRITREEEHRVVCKNDVPEFVNPETLIHYLRRHAPRGPTAFAASTCGPRMRLFGPRSGG